MIIVDPPELEMEKNVGKYVIMYNSEKFLVKLEEFDREQGTVIFRQVSGSDNGKRFKSRYDRNYSQVRVYRTKKEGLRSLYGPKVNMSYIPITTKKKKKKHGRKFSVKGKR